VQVPVKTQVRGKVYTNPDAVSSMLSIHPIKCGTLDSLKSSFTYRVDEAKEITIPVISFLITSGDQNEDRVILVDTGIREPNEQGVVNGVGVSGGGPEPIIEELAKHSHEPADVDYVILTHLHHDHTSNNEIFSDAEFIIQRSELEAALDPLPPVESTYDDEVIASIEDLNVTLVDGDHRLTENIELLYTPGHTEGMQSVIVDTGNGVYGLISDLAYSRQNLEPSTRSIIDGNGNLIQTTPVDWNYIPPGIHINVQQCYNSIHRIKERVGEDGTLIPGHAGSVLNRTFE
jgi:glyoxylase-like metal-dependent hydrolase (beta-lactamase superfamily II)